MNVDLVLTALIVGMLDLFEHAHVEQVLEGQVDRLVEEQQFVFAIDEATKRLEGPFGLQEFLARLRRSGLVCDRLLPAGFGLLVPGRPGGGLAVGGRLRRGGRLRGDGRVCWLFWQGLEHLGCLGGKLQPRLTDAAVEGLRGGEFCSPVFEPVAEADDRRLVLRVDHPNLGCRPLLGRAGGVGVWLLKRHPRHETAGRHRAEPKRKRLLPPAEHYHQQQGRGRADAEPGEHFGPRDPRGEVSPEAVGCIDGSPAADAASLLG